MKYILLIFCSLYLSSCKICTKTFSRTHVKVEKKNLVCSCRSLQTNASFEARIHSIEGSSTICFFGEVITTKDKKGIYQYVRMRAAIKKNRFMYYNGTDVYLVNEDNLSFFADSLDALGISKKKIDKILPEIKKSLAVPAQNVSDSF